MVDGSSADGAVELNAGLKNLSIITRAGDMATDAAAAAAIEAIFVSRVVLPTGNSVGSRFTPI